MKKIYYFLLFLAAFVITGCNDFLDILPDDKPELRDAFIDKFNAEKYLYTCYNSLPPFADPNNTLGLSGGGDIIYSFTGVGASPSRPMMALINGNNVINPYVNFWEGRNGAANLWEGIRHCNVFLENIDIDNGGPRDLEEWLRAQWKAEVKTIKAFLHFYLFRLYGPIPIMDKATPISAPQDEVNVYREPVDDVVDYIVKTLDEAIDDLPEKSELDKASEYGRFDKTIARSIKAQTLVLAASPIFNNNNFYNGIKDRRGVELFPTGDRIKKWERALEAIDEACRSAEADGAAIHITTDGGNNLISGINVLNINDTTKCMVNLRQAVTESWNPEVIWATNESTTTLQRWSAMISDIEWWETRGGDLGSLGQRHAPTINIIEKFYSSNGLPIDEDADWKNNGWYENRYRTQLPDEEHSKYFIKKGQETAILHFNRSMRFYASVGFEGGMWEGRDRSLAQASYPSFMKGYGCGFKYSELNYSITGYLAKKLCHLKTQYTGTSLNFVVGQYSFPIIRLADLYLLLAECLNEVGGPTKTDTQGKDAYYYLDLIRSRSGMEGVVESWRKYALDQFKNKPSEVGGLRSIIQQERLNELAFEGNYYYDIRRWLIAEEVLNQPIFGWNKAGANKQEFFNRRVLLIPRFTMKDYLMPLSSKALLQNTNIEQNPGWQSNQ